MCLTTLAILFLLFVKFSQTYFIAQEQLLISKLFQTYDPLARPVLNNKLALNISVSITLTQGIEISEKDQLLMTSLLIEQVKTKVNE